MLFFGVAAGRLGKEAQLGEHVEVHVIDRKMDLNREDWLEVSIEKIIHFFDEDLDRRQHASSVKAVVGEELAFACMVKFFEDKGAHASLLVDKRNNRTACTTGGRKGFQLDGWLKVSSRHKTVLYQTEVKSWSFHGIGGRDRRLPLVASVLADDLKIKGENLEMYRAALNGEVERDFDSVRKVLFKMRVPTGYEKEAAMASPQPLLCIWEAVCDKGDRVGAPLFAMKVKRFKFANRVKDNLRLAGGDFPEVQIFSVSNYLRAKLKGKEATRTIRLYLPKIAERQRILRGLLGG